MATKRELKKYVRNVCGSLAAEIVLARAAFPVIARKDVYAILLDIAELQSTTLARTSISYGSAGDRRKDEADYNKKHRAYYKAAYTKLLESFDASVAEIVKKMNAALPEEVRKAIKTAAAE